MKHLMYFFGVGVILCAILISGCKKEEDDPIDAFIRSYTGEYVERDCGSGGPTQGSFSLEDATLRITKKTENSASLVCSHGTLGNIFSVEGVYESDTTLTILPIEIDGRNFTGRFFHYRSGNGGKWLGLDDEEIACRFLGDPVSNLSFSAN